MIVNRDQCAAALGISKPTLDSWVRKGCPIEFRGGRGVEWKISLPAVVAWREGQVRAAAAGEAPGDEEQLKRRKLAAEAGEAELRFAKLRGEVALIAEFERATAKMMAAIRANVMNVPARAVLQLLGEKDEATFKRVLRAELTQALDQSAQADFDLDEESEEPEDDE